MEINRVRKKDRSTNISFYINAYNIITVGVYILHCIALGYFSFKALVVIYVSTTLLIKIAQVLLKFAKPEAYFTDGFFDALNKKFFWNFGPQTIVTIIILLFTIGFVENGAKLKKEYQPSKDGINFRSSPNGKILGELKTTDKFYCNSITDDWCKFVKDEKTAYVYFKLLTPSK